MPETVDAVVIGAGHNGLVAAAYLARAGLRVVVVERRGVVGGAAVTEEVAPGFRAPTAATAVGLLRPEVAADLELSRRGLRLLPMDPALVSVGTGSQALRLWRDPSETRKAIARLSGKDAEAFPRFVRFLVTLARLADPLMARPPPEVPDPSTSDVLLLARRAWQLRKLGREGMYAALRFPPMSLHAFLGEWFEADLVKGTLAVDGLLGTFRGPWSPGTAFGLLHAYAAFLGGGWALVRGGTGALSNALADAAREAGAVIRTGASVVRILAEDGRATGVELASGQAVPARIVVSNADPKHTFLRLVEPTVFDAKFVNAVRNIQTEGCVAKVNLALDSLPDLRADGVGPAPPHVRIAPSLEYLERAYDDAKSGRPSEDPFVDAVVPTLVDPELAPPGKHVMSIGAQYAPHCLRGRSWESEREAFGERVVDLLDGAMPGLRRAIVARQVLSPVDLEERFGLTDGHPHHGEMTMNQQYVLRPVPGWARYRTPLENLYLCGAGTHPGGGITGAPGYIAAQEILRDWRRARQRRRA